MHKLLLNDLWYSLETKQWLQTFLIKEVIMILPSKYRMDASCTEVLLFEEKGLQPIQK